MSPQQNPGARDRIKSRKPTGEVSHPCILIEGEEKAGKTYRAYELTKSERVGEAFVIDLGEGSADEYAPIGDYLVVEHDGTFGDVLDQVRAIHEYAGEQNAAGEKPVVLVIDTASDEWGVLCDAIAAKAAQSERNRKALRDDPAAEVKIPNHLWNDANAKHRRLMTLLLTFPGIVVMTARGKEVAEIRNGAPVEGSKVWKVEGQKNLAFDASAWIRMRRNGKATLEGARSIYVGLRPGLDAARDLPDEWEERGLEWFIFDALRYDPAKAQVRDLRELSDDGESLDGPRAAAPPQAEQSPEQLLNRIQAAWDNPAGLRLLHKEATARGMLNVEVVGPNGTMVDIDSLITVRGRELVAAQEKQNGDGPPPEEQPATDAERLRAAAEKRDEDAA